MSQARRRQPVQETSPRMGRRGWWTIGLMGALAVVTTLIVQRESWMPEFEGPAFETLVIKGERWQLSVEKIRDWVKPSLEPGYFGADLSALRDELEAEPWVRSVSVRRQWPSTLELTVREQVPVAIWNRSGFLTAEAEFFVPREIYREPGALPELGGPEGSEEEVLQVYRDAVSQLAPIGLEAESLILSDRRAWQLELKDGPVLRLGREDRERRFDRFVQVAYPALKESGRYALDELDYIDMRYTNGFSLAPSMISDAGEAEESGNG